MIDALRREMGYSISTMCPVREVSKGGYYIWKNRKPSARKQEEELVKVAAGRRHLWLREDLGRAEVGRQ